MYFEIQIGTGLPKFRLQRRLHRIHTVCFLKLMNNCDSKPVSFFAKYVYKPLKTKFKAEA